MSNEMKPIQAMKKMTFMPIKQNNNFESKTDIMCCKLLLYTMHTLI
jgi:hypothetical protein